MQPFVHESTHSGWPRAALWVLVSMHDIVYSRFHVLYT